MFWVKNYKTGMLISQYNADENISFDFMGYLTPVTSPLDRSDATFRIVPAELFRAWPAGIRFL